MTRFGFKLFTAVFLTLSAGSHITRAAATNELPEFKEVYDLLRSHLAGTTEADLNRAVVEGVFTSLRGKVSLVSSEESPEARTGAGLVAKSSVLEEDVAYVRTPHVGDGLAQEINSAFQRLNATNQLKGVVLDLRFADGDDYAAAAAVADLFLARERPLLDWGKGMMKSREKPDAIRLPVAVLVNRDTSGAAEALAAIFRETGTGMILGGTTAGGAMIAKDFPLKNGQLLRIATSPVTLGDGTRLSAALKPDIEVAVANADERAYLDDAYVLLLKTNTASISAVAGRGDGTNRPPRRPRISEADLVRERRDGTNLNVDDFTSVRDREPEKAVIRDPVLARAVDLLKGLAVVRKARS